MMTLFKAVMKLKPQSSSTFKVLGIQLIGYFNFLLRSCENFQPDLRRNVRRPRTLREKVFMPGEFYLVADRFLSVSFITTSWFLFSFQTLGLKVMLVLKLCAKNAVRAEMSKLLRIEILAWNFWLATKCFKRSLNFYFVPVQVWKKGFFAKAKQETVPVGFLFYAMVQK